MLSSPLNVMQRSSMSMVAPSSRRMPTLRSIGVLGFRSRWNRRFTLRPPIPAGTSCSDSAGIGALSLTPRKHMLDGLCWVVSLLPLMCASSVSEPAQDRSHAVSTTAYPMGMTPSDTAYASVSLVVVVIVFVVVTVVPHVVVVVVPLSLPKFITGMP